MKLKVNTKALIASTVALAVIPFTKATAETLEDWVARSVDEIKHDIILVRNADHRDRLFKIFRAFDDDLAVSTALNDTQKFQYRQALPQGAAPNSQVFRKLPFGRQFLVDPDFSARDRVQQGFHY